MIFHLLLCLILGLIRSKCPAQCESICTIPGDLCSACLTPFFQIFSLSRKTCVCQEGFKHFIQTQNSCCPYECQSCGNYGCSSCHENNSTMSVRFFPSFFLNCTCLQNFYHDLGSHKCMCLAETDNKNYFYNPITGECFKCPQGCQCSQSGCVSCNNQSQRVIKITEAETYYCPCITNYKEINGVCQCPKYCSCENGTVVSCQYESNRYDLFGTWLCIFPYRQRNGLCRCFAPYTISNASGFCVCPTKTIQVTTVSLQYYTFEGLCYECLGSCTCNYRGCVSCPANGMYAMINGSCFCSQNYTRLTRTCLCKIPYYQISQGNCRCMSQINSSLHYYDSVQGQCLKCPSGCTCSEQGCIRCENYTLRIISINSKNEHICKCESNAFESIGGVCICLTPYFRSSSNNCVCNTNYTSDHSDSIVYLNIDKDQCNYCPQGCICSSKGCIICSESSLRQITTNSENISVCDCIRHAQLTKYKVCRCSLPYSLNSETMNCECQEPYYLNDTQCVCKSLINPTKYYWNSRDNSCRECPQQCICSTLGCISCTNDSLRYIASLTNSICQCYQQSSQMDNKCFVCQSGYFYDNQCIQCLGCLSCNRNGCLSCSEGLHLEGNDCVCDNPSFVNWNGTCRCYQGSFQDHGQCKVCTPNCNTCQLLSNKLECTSCKQGMNRLMTITSRCDCLPGYKQAFPIQEYCCNKQCFSCNPDGCTKCYPYSYRALVDNQCQCVYPFVDIGQSYCICESGYYLVSGQCLHCSMNCLTCKFQQKDQSIVCLSCNLFSNRNVTSPSCSCLLNYTQTFPASTFCVTDYCASNTLICTKCISPRVLYEGKCVCPNGTYQTYRFNCQSCYIKGCQICLSFDLCTKCNTRDNYYLTSSTCTKRDLFYYLYAYKPDHTGVVVQFQLRQLTAKISFAEVNIFEVGTNGNQFESPTLLSIIEDVDWFLLTYTNVITLTFANAKITYQNVMISFVINYYPLHNSTQAKTEKYSLLHKTVYSDPHLSVFKQTAFCIWVFIYVFIVMVLALLLHVRGHKHNQVMFFLQTMSFCVFAIFRPQLEHISVLFYLRASYFGFGPGPFHNYFPEYYVEAAPRNYRFLTKDCNFLRVAGVPLLITILIGLICFILRFLYVVSYNNSNQKPNRVSKDTIKIIYRVFQFLYKLFMYPMIFFSIQTFFNWDAYIFTDHMWKIVARIVSVLMFSIYFLLTVIQIKYQMIPRSSKIQIINEYLSTIVTSIFIISNQEINKNQYLLMVILPLFARDMVYIYNLYKYWEIFFYSYALIFAPTVLQMMPVFVMIFVQNRYALFVSIVIVNLTQFAAPGYIMRIFNKHLKKDKVTVAIIQKDQNITSKHMVDVTDII